MATTNNVKGCIGILMIEDSMRFPRYSRFAIVRQDSPRPVPKLGPFEIAHKISSLDALGIRAKSRVFRAAGLTSDTHELADE